MFKEACQAFIVNRDKILLFHRDDKPGIEYPGTWNFLGGRLENGESPMDALQREIREEGGYTPEYFCYLGYLIREEKSKEFIFWTRVTDEEAAMFQHQQGSEGQGVAWWTWDQIQDLPLHGSMRLFIENDERRNSLSKHITYRTRTIPSSEELELEI